MTRSTFSGLDDTSVDHARRSRDLWLAGSAAGALLLATLAPAAHAADLVDDGGGDVSAVVVNGKRNASAAQQVEAIGATNVLSADQIQRNPDQNVVDALARLPGVSVSPTDNMGSPSQGNHHGVDAAGRGEGSFVSLRGLNGAYNVNLLNGVNAAQGMPYSRQIELSLLPPVGLDRIVVSKTSTADMDGDAIGGTIDFRTPTGLDFKEPMTRIYVQAGLAQLPLRYGLKGGSGLAQAELARRFGADGRFGLYATAYYGKRNFASTMQDYQAGQWEHAISDGEQGSHPVGMDKSDNLLLTSLNAQFTRGRQKRYGAIASLDWEGERTTLYARGSFARSIIDQEVYQKSIQADGYSAGVLRPDGLYQNAEDDGDYHYWFETSPEVAELDSFQLGGRSRFGRLTVDYNAFYSWGENSAPDHAEITYQTSADNDLNGPFTVTYRDRYPVPQLTPAQLARLNDSRLFLVGEDSGEFTSSRSEQRKTGGKVDFHYDVDHDVLSDVAFGAKYVESRRETSSRDYSGLNPYPAGSTLADNPLIDRTLGQTIKGVYPYALPIGDGAALTDLMAGLAKAQTLSADDFNKNSLSGTEKVSSVYVLANLKLGVVEVQPGLRYEHTDIHDTFWNQVTNPDDSPGASAFASNQTTYDFVLPSVHANYRPDAETVVRASVWRSYVRPAFFQLAGGRTTSLNPDGSIDITEGNPNLKAISAVNYDVSYEHAGADGTQVMVGLFLKDLSNYLYDRGNTYRAQTVAQTGISSISRPENGGDARVYGLEMSARRQFTELQGWLGGLGVSGNLTLQRSKVDLKDPGTDNGMRMQGSPDLLYNASLFYDRDGLTATLSYRYGGPTLVSYRFGDYGGADLNEWQRATRTLDASVAYQFRSGLKLTLSASNLLNDYGYYRTVGRDSGTIPQLVSSGRNAFISAAYSF